VPLDLVDVGEERRIRSESRQRLEQQSPVALGAQHSIRKRLDRTVPVQQRRCGALTDPRNSRVAILSISDERE